MVTIDRKTASLGELALRRVAQSFEEKGEHESAAKLRATADALKSDLIHITDNRTKH